MRKLPHGWEFPWVTACGSERSKGQSPRRSRKEEILMSTLPRIVSSMPESFVDPESAATYLRTTRRHVLEMVRGGLIPGHPLDAQAKKKDWRFLLSELHAYMLSCDQRPPGARKPPRRV